MIIKPLSFDRLEESNTLRNRVFKYLSLEEKQTLNASLDAQNYSSILAKLALMSLEYWVAIYENKVVGLIGLYEETSDHEDSIWLGWYCVDEKYRGLTIGKKLISFAIEEAKKKNKYFLKLYTTLHDEYAVARDLYEKLGFFVTFHKGKTLHYHLNLGNKDAR
ncbi:GNAT family N-acetyltransferase [Sulfurospirillum sp. UCH001]|uniref:GNAT family N-acetyltransferase n=1 Tax=Sulfurospirillum sp. UCH001 TaxID=1581011 RepID=UPI00082B1614|nr:GNAT family N-acetyltransferase [Sulfurospirillum sp. UCH001]